MILTLVQDTLFIEVDMHSQVDFWLILLTYHNVLNYIYAMRFILTIFLIISFSVGFSQFNEIGIVPFKRGIHGVTQHRKYLIKFLTSAYYLRSYDKYHIIVSAEYGVNSVGDYCESCNDAFQGEGLFKELNLYLGVGTLEHTH